MKDDLRLEQGTTSLNEAYGGIPNRAEFLSQAHLFERGATGKKTDRAYIALTWNGNRISIHDGWECATKEFVRARTKTTKIVCLQWMGEGGTINKFGWSEWW